MEKLVRDLIPNIIMSSGGSVTVRQAAAEEREELLRQKFREEVDEFLAKPSVEEMADVVEVLSCFASLKEWSPEDFIQVFSEKRRERGCFGRFIVMRTADAVPAGQED